MSIQLAGDNVQEYTREVILPNLSVGTTVIDSREVTENSMVNWVFAVDITNGDLGQTLYVRQGRDHAKKDSSIVRDLRRVGIEADALRYLGKIVPGTVPEVIHYDEQNHVLVLSDVRRGGQLLTDELQAGRVHPEVGVQLGKTLATIQNVTKGKTLKDILGDKTPDLFGDTMVDYLKDRLVAADLVAPAMTDYLLKRGNASRTLLLGDLASKNIFVEGDKARFFDLERVTTGDPAYDPAYLLCHYLIETPVPQRDHALEFVDLFMKSYVENLDDGHTEGEISSLEDRIIRYIGFSILHRTSPKAKFPGSFHGEAREWEAHGIHLLDYTKAEGVSRALRHLFDTHR